MLFMMIEDHEKEEIGKHLPTMFRERNSEAMLVAGIVKDLKVVLLTSLWQCFYRV